MNDFFKKHQKALNDFSRMSCAVGERADYVQGGGGNTSVKLEGGLMAIKASGFHLCDVKEKSGYAVVSGQAVREFYLNSNPNDFEDVEQAGAAKTKENTLSVPGLPSLRPSVEVGFHSLLDTFVSHSHSVYANLAACSDDPQKYLDLAFKDAPYSCALAPYVNPGAMLTFTIRDAMAKTKAETGKAPSVILMQNHGLIAHADTAETCLALHEDANLRFQQVFSVTKQDFPKPVIRAVEGGFESDTPWLRQRLKGDLYSDELLLTEPLYPDQMVFFQGVIGETAKIDRETGITSYLGLNEKNARTLEETLCAVVFILETLHRHGIKAVPMSDAARAFIHGWESEKYRKALSEGK
ncbi:MAG: class II aldolase/adducin family protein [Bacillota bacterium]|nr:class II aldolase/adducin family protein [Bacillota bacterium]